MQKSLLIIPYLLVVKRRIGSLQSEDSIVEKAEFIILILVAEGRTRSFSYALSDMIITHMCIFVRIFATSLAYYKRNLVKTDDATRDNEMRPTPTLPA